MPNPKRTRAQHYVPQFYLRGFTNVAGQLFCLDKLSGKSYPTTTQKAAQESDFYEIRPGTTVAPVSVNAIEQKLGQLEAAYAPILANIIKGADAGIIDFEQLHFFAPFVAVQWMRTKTFRDTAYELMTKNGQTLVDDLTRLNFPDLQKMPHFVINPDCMPAVHAEYMLNPDIILPIARELDQHYWVVGLNHSEHFFYTSDHPVVRRANCSDQAGPLLGIGDTGIQFALPLDSKHILLIFERIFFPQWRKHDGRSVELT